MATFKPVVRTDKEFNAVYIRIIAFTKPAYIKTSMIVHKSGIEKGEITDYSILGNCYIQIKEYTEKLNNVNTENWTATEIKDFLMKGKEDISFTDFADDFIKQMRNDDRDKQATNYKASVTSLKKHLKKENLLFSDITSNEISKWLKSLEKTARAKQLYPTHINKIFKSGMREFNDYERDIIRIKYNPFELVKIPSADAPKKRFADLDVVHKILAATPMYEREKQAQDVVRLILCLAGINTVDLYNMEKDEFIDGKFCYNRTKEEKIRKDKAYFEIKVPELILPILEKYQGKKNFFIFRERYSDADGFRVRQNIILLHSV